MLLRFTKMHGLGNDFMMVDQISQRAHLKPALIEELSNRKTGIGFDQLLTVSPPDDPEADFRYRIFNADGSEAEQCGNGHGACARARAQVSSVTSSTAKISSASSCTSEARNVLIAALRVGVRANCALR